MVDYQDPPRDPAARIEALEREVKALREEMRVIKKQLQAYGRPGGPAFQPGIRPPFTPYVTGPDAPGPSRPGEAWC